MMAALHPRTQGIVLFCARRTARSSTVVSPNVLFEDPAPLVVLKFARAVRQIPCTAKNYVVSSGASTKE